MKKKAMDSSAHDHRVRISEAMRTDVSAKSWSYIYARYREVYVRIDVGTAYAATLVIRVPR